MRQVVRRYFRHIAFTGVLFLMFFSFQAGRITRDMPERVSKRPVQIGEPVEYVRGNLCLPFETLDSCDRRVP